MLSADVCKFSCGRSTWVGFIFIVTGLVWPTLMTHRAHKMYLSRILRLRGPCKDCLYFVYAFCRCVQTFLWTLHLGKFHFHHSRTSITMLMTHIAHKHVSWGISRLHGPCKDCLYFVYAFCRCVQIFNRSLHLGKIHFHHNRTSMTQALDT